MRQRDPPCRLSVRAVSSASDATERLTRRKGRVKAAREHARAPGTRCQRPRRWLDPLLRVLPQAEREHTGMHGVHLCRCDACDACRARALVLARRASDALPASASSTRSAPPNLPRNGGLAWRTPPCRRSSQHLAPPTTPASRASPSRYGDTTSRWSSSRTTRIIRRCATPSAIEAHLVSAHCPAGHSHPGHSHPSSASFVVVLVQPHPHSPPTAERCPVPLLRAEVGERQPR